MIATLPGVFAAAAAPAPPRGGTGAVARCPRAHLCRSVAWRPQPTADESKKSLVYYEIPLSLTRGPPCGWGLGRVRFYSGAPAGPHLPPFGEEVGGSCP